MISRRNFVVICMMMVVILFMFQFSQIIKENGNEYGTNEYWNKYLDSGKITFRGLRENDPRAFRGAEYVMFWGDTNTKLMEVVDQWCVYTKRNLLTCDASVSIPTDQRYQPSILLIDSETRDVFSHVKEIEKLTKNGVTVVFCNLPPYSELQRSAELKDILGISTFRMETTTIEGIRLFEGFLVGGGAVYKAETEKEEKLQDFELTVPWYITGKGTKSYMVGLKDDKLIDREKFPRLIWRNTHNNAMVFAVNGDFMSSLTGLGLLDAFVYESSDYYLYPVVNGQSVSVVDYPSLSNENSDVMEEVYSRNTSSFLRDIVWPNLLAGTLRNELKLTCYVSTKYDYHENSGADVGLLTFYLQQMKEVGAEAGRSLRYDGAITLADKAKADRIFFDHANCGYRFAAYYVDSLSDEFLELANSADGMDEMRTVSCRDRGRRPLLSFYTDYTTVLGVTHDAGEYSYRKDLELRGINTALAYSNMMMDMHHVLWPEEERHQWQFFYEDVSSNIASYYSGFHVFEQTTMSESDARVRAMLNTNYSVEREGDTLKMSIMQTTEGGWFLLRTHGEQIKEIENGEYKRVEQDVFLIHTLDSKVRIELEKAEEVFLYEGPIQFPWDK